MEENLTTDDQARVGEAPAAASTGILNGTVRIVLTLAVTSSPITPLPRVAARVSSPLLVTDYDGQAVQLGLQDIAQLAAGGQKPQVALLPIGASPASSKALAKLSIGAGCATLGKSPLKSEPTRCVGESARAYCGCSASRVPQFTQHAVVFAVAGERIIQHVIAVDCGGAALSLKSAMRPRIGSMVTGSIPGSPLPSANNWPPPSRSLRIADRAVATN